MRSRFATLFVTSLAAGIVGCSDEPRPCGWLAPTPEPRDAPSFEYACGGEARPIEVVSAYTCLNCVNYGEQKGIEVRFELHDTSSVDGEYVGVINVILPEEPSSGTITFADDPEAFSGADSIEQATLVYQRGGEMPYIDVAEDDLEEGVEYTATIDVTLDFSGSLSRTNCEDGTVEVTDFQTTIAATAEASFCEPLELEDLGDIRIGH